MHQTSTTKLLAFFQKVYKAAHTLWVTEIKISLENAFAVDLFALEGETESKYDKKLFFESFRRFFTCLLTISFRKMHIYVFPDYFSFSHFLASNCCLLKSGLSSLISAHKFQAKQATQKKMKFSIKGFCNKYDQIHRRLRIWPYLLKKSVMENFIFCAVP